MRVKLLSVPVAVALLAGCGGEPEPKTVPELRGQRLDVAERRLDDAGLEYERVGGGAVGIVVRSNWRVCDQEPKAGARATRVRLIVDRRCPPPQPRTYLVPNLVGRTVGDAEGELARLGIPFEERSAFGRHPVRAAWEVCRQRPEPGDRASRIVIFADADCEPPPAPAVPDVVGVDLGEAEEILGARGIAVEPVPSDAEPFYDVCSQDPRAGSRSRSVTLFVARSC